MVYYTPEFAANTADIGTFVDHMISVANTGYANSGINLELIQHCIAEAPRPIQDVSTPGQQLDEMKTMMGSRNSVDKLLNTADVAVLLTNEWKDKCGKANGVYTVESGENFAVVKKSCAAGYYSFGHEISHLLGAGHNKDFKPS